MRVLNYEILRANDWCMQLYKVMPEDWNGKAKYRRSKIDGRALKPLDCYPSDISAALRKVYQLVQIESVDYLDTLDSAIERLEVFKNAVSVAANRAKGAM